MLKSRCKKGGLNWLEKESSRLESLLWGGDPDLPRGHALYTFDIVGNLRLLPKFNEKDPETLFSFERVADSRSWPDSDSTLLLQCVDW